MITEKEKFVNGEVLRKFKENITILLNFNICE